MPNFRYHPEYPDYYENVREKTENDLTDKCIEWKNETHLKNLEVIELMSDFWCFIKNFGFSNAW